MLRYLIRNSISSFFTVNGMVINLTLNPSVSIEYYQNYQIFHQQILENEY